MLATAKIIAMPERNDGPQLEDGYLRVANELEDAILLKIRTFRHSQVVRAVIRKTYGYGKKEDDVSLSQIADMTGLQRPHVSVAIRELESMGVLNPVRPGAHGQILGLNKHHQQWKTCVTETATVTKTVTQERVTETVTVAETVTQTAVTETVRDCYQNGNEGVTETVQNVYQNSNNKRQPQKTTPKDNPKRESAPCAPDAGRGSRLTKDWTLPADWRVWALQEQPTWSPEHAGKVAESFRDYWVAIAGSKGRKADWEATWRNWVRRESPMKAQQAAPRQPSRHANFDLIDYHEGISADGRF